MSAPRPREKAQVLDETALDRALTRIAHEILEKNGGAKDLAFVGLRTRGVSLAHRLAAKIMTCLADLADSKTRRSWARSTPSSGGLGG